MTDAKEQQPGLVKKLLFPAYTDAGSNENFRTAAASHQDDGLSESDATTAILDNRSASKPQHHEVQYDGRKVGGYAPSVEDIRPLNDSLLTHTGTEPNPQETVRLLPSSKDAPPSPPLIPAQGLGQRSSSTTTHNGIRPFPTTSPRVPNIDHSLDHSSVTAVSSVAASSVVGVNFLNGSNQREEEPTPVKDNRSMNLGNSSVFEPRLADLGDDDMASEIMSDVNSTASEMGTVVGAPGRLEEVQRMAAYMERSGESLYEADSAADEPLSQAKDVPELALPTLDERRIEETSLPSTKSRSGVFREKMDSVFREQRSSSPPPPPPPPPPQQESPSSASALVSAAIRRIGSGVGNISQSNKSPTKGTHSAPTTPRHDILPSPRVEDYLRSTLSSQRSNDQPSKVAHLLRSPGSAVYFQSDGSKRYKQPRLAPRFSSRFAKGERHPNESSRFESRQTLRHADSLASPLRFARGCVSFDNTIEATQNETIPEYQPRSPLAHLTDVPQTPVQQSRSWDVASTTSSMNPQVREPKTPMGSYRSFAFGKSPESSTCGAPTQSAFRPAPLTRVRHANAFNFSSRGSERYGAKTLDNISPAVANASAKDALALRTPQRIEIEREDALDILACLVERSVAFDQELATTTQVETIVEVDEMEDDATSQVVSEGGDKVQLTDDDRVSTFADVGVQELLHSPPPTQRKTAIDLLGADLFSYDLSNAITEIRRISQDYERTISDSSKSSGTTHSSRMKAVDELLRSHTYAAEMRRAAKSASTWLHSIGRSEGHNSVSRLTIPAETSSEPNESQGQETNQSAGEHETEGTKTVDKMDLVALRAMLHSAELKAKEKDDMTMRLNEELSKCRAEIGRLKTASRTEDLFTSPNKSILDNDESSSSSAEASTTESTGANAFTGVLDNTSPIAKIDTDKDVSIDASFVRSDVVLGRASEEVNDQWHAMAESKREAVLLKTALSKANETIRKLHEQISRGERDDISASGSLDAPVVSVDSHDLGQLLDDYKEAVRREHASNSAQAPLPERRIADSRDASDRRMINVRMLDGENFVTEWDDLAPPLPPPPDHGLRSPIVMALLQQWTSDASMHDSLLSWIENILNGSAPETIPPLTISALDHQVRDGFAMHLLPLLLRRPDILVDVKTRAHRRTYYDMSVSVSSSLPQGHDASSFSSNEQPVPPSTNQAKKTQLMAFKASHGNGTVVDDSMLADLDAPTAPHDVSEHLRTNSATLSSDVLSDSVAHSAATALITNSSKRISGESHSLIHSSHQRGFVQGAHVEDKDIAEIPGHLSRAMLGDDISTSSSTTGGSSQKSGQNQGIMGAIGGAFGGLLKRKPSEPEHSHGESVFGDENGILTDERDALPSFLRHAPQPPPSQTDDDGQPYHRVVSAPPGRIGVTFVDYRGHAMVSDVAHESPLSGWVFPSDILIAIDEVPVSGMRVRDIIKLLTSRKDRQRALRMISSHAMNEFTLNTSTPSEAGAPS